MSTRIAVAALTCALLHAGHCLAAPQYSVFNPSTKFFRYGNWGGGGWSNSGWPGTSAAGVDAMDAAFKQHDLHYAGGNLIYGSAWAAAPAWQKPIVYAQWVGSRLSADSTLRAKLLALPALTIYPNGSDSWGYKVETYGSMPKSKIWRLSMRLAVIQYIDITGPMLPPPL